MQNENIKTNSKDAISEPCTFSIKLCMKNNFIIILSFCQMTELMGKRNLDATCDIMKIGIAMSIIHINPLHWKVGLTNTVLRFDTLFIEKPLWASNLLLVHNAICVWLLFLIFAFSFLLPFYAIFLQSAQAKLLHISYNVRFDIWSDYTP